MILAKIKCIINIVTKLLATGLSNSSSFSMPRNWYCWGHILYTSSLTPHRYQCLLDIHIYGNPAYPTPFQLFTLIHATLKKAPVFLHAPRTPYCRNPGPSINWSIPRSIPFLWIPKYHPHDRCLKQKLTMYQILFTYYSRTFLIWILRHRLVKMNVIL